MTDQSTGVDEGAADPPPSPLRDIKAESAGIAAGSVEGDVHQENFNGLVIKLDEGNLIYQAVVDDEQVEFNAAEIENDYLDRVARSELATVGTMLGRVPIERLTIPSYLVPLKAGRDAPEASTAAISRDSAVRALDALEIAPRLVVVAGPGMGKTTFLNALASTLATRRTGQIPVPISLYRYVTEAEGRPLIDFAVETRFGEMYKGKELAAFADVLRLWNRDGKVIFLLDGLDEVPEDLRRPLVDQFTALTRFVLTTRPIGRVDAYQPQGGTLQLLPLDDRDVARFIYQWAALDGVDSAFVPRVVIGTVRRDTRLADLAKVPQLLGLICYLWSRGTIRAFRTRADLFAQTTDTMIAKGLDQLEVIGEERETLPRALRRWLRKLALDMLAHPAGSRLRISRDAMLDDLEIGRTEVEGARVFRLARASGLIVRAIDGIDDFQFVHLVFQEYLAAEALAASDDPIRLTARLQHRAAFEEPLRMACAIWADRGEDDRIRGVLQNLIEPDQADRFGSNVALAGRCLSEIDHVEQRMPGLVDEVEDGLLAYASKWWLRARFTPVMAQLKTNGMRRRLVTALSSEEFFVRWAAAIALGLMGDPATLTPIRERLNIEPSDVVSTALVEAIANLGSPVAVPDLMGVLTWLTKQPDPDVFLASAIGAALARLEAIDELKLLVPHVEDEVVGDALFEALQYLPAKHASILVEALKAAGTTVRYSIAEEIEPGPSLDDVEAAAASDDPAVRLGAIQDLGRVGNFDARWTLLRLVTDEEPSVAESAASELEGAWSQGWGLLWSIDELAGLLATSQEAETRAWAAGVIMGLWDIPRTRDAIVSRWDEQVQDADERAEKIEGLLADEDDQVRAAAASLLGLMRAVGRIAELGNAAQADASDDVRKRAIWAMGRLRDRAGLPFLLDIHADAADELEAVANALGDIESPEAVPRLIELLAHESAQVRRAAAVALSPGGDERALPDLLRATEDADRDVRLAAMRSLGSHDDPRLSSRLVPLLSSDDRDVRAASAAGLRSARGDDVDAALARVAVSDLDQVVTYAAVESLGQRGRGDRAVEALSSLLSADVEDLRVEASTALGELGSKAARPRLRAILASDASEAVRSGVASAFGRLADHGDITSLIDELSNPDDHSALGAVSSFLASHPDANVADLSQKLAAHDIGLLARDDFRAVIMMTPHGDTRTRIGDPEDFVPEGTNPVDFYVSQLQANGNADRWDAADALGRIKAVASIPALVQALLDEDPIVAHEAARAIENMTREEGLSDSAAMALTAAVADARSRGMLDALIGLLIDERSSTVTGVVRQMLSVPEALCELLADDSDDDDVQAVLCTIAERYNLRLMPDGGVIMPTGERLACDAARSHLGVA